ncbi:hypothetical protein [Carboxylicivirga taeanensis]|uniref:hypothetical protein n=1 Tax=Carboxylicivirga taeanensis TaxID=1416875 RepID=UPI003F6DCFE1
MKMILISLVLFIFSTTTFWAQEKELSHSELSRFKNNVIYIEGVIMNSAKYNYGYPTLVYERYIDRLYQLSFKIGLSSNFKSTTNIPFSINWLSAGLRHHHLEFGAGGIISINDYTYEDNNIVAYGIFLPMMYRYQKAGGLVIRAGANAIFGLQYFIAPSLSLGYNF